MPVFDEMVKISISELLPLTNKLDKQKSMPGISTPRSKDSIFKQALTVPKDAPFRKAKIGKS